MTDATPIPPAEAPRKARNKRPMRLTTAIVILCASASLALGSIGFATFAFFTHQTARQTHGDAIAKQQTAEKRKADQEAAAAAAAAAEAAARQRVEDEQFRDAEAIREYGFFPSPSEYGVFFRGEEGGQCTFAMPCSLYTVIVTKSCPGGVFVSSNLITNGVVISHGNTVTGALSARQSATFRIDYPYGDGGEQAQLTAARCR